MSRHPPSLTRSDTLCPHTALFRSALNGWTLIQAEQPARLAEQGLLPAWFARQNRHGTPAAALLLSSVIATACVILNNSKSTSEMFTFMAVLSTSVTLWLSLACAASALRLRVAIPGAPTGLAYAVWTWWGAGDERKSVVWGKRGAGGVEI